MLRLENYSIEQYPLYTLNLENYREALSLQNKETHFIVRAQDINNCKTKEITDNDCEIIILPCALKRMNQGKTLIIGSSQNNMKNEGIIELLKKAWNCSDNIEKQMAIKEIVGYVDKVLQFRWLSPKIQKMILTGEHSEKLTSHHLRMLMSIDFAEQEKQLRLQHTNKIKKAPHSGVFIINI